MLCIHELLTLLQELLLLLPSNPVQPHPLVVVGLQYNCKPLCGTASADKRQPSFTDTDRPNPAYYLSRFPTSTHHPARPLPAYPLTTHITHPPSTYMSNL